MEKETTEFSCDISKPNLKVKWLKGDKEIKADKRHDIIVIGNKYVLVIKHGELDDQAEYGIVAEEGVQSTAKLVVEGMLYTIIQDDGKDILTKLIINNINVFQTHVHLELPLEIVKPMRNTEVMEKKTITLECELNKPNKTATWKQNGHEILPTEEFERFKVIF